MLEQTQQLRTPQSAPHTGSKKSLMLWAILGFVLGVSPIIIFLVFFPLAKTDKPMQREQWQALVAKKLHPQTSADKTAAPSPSDATDQSLSTNQDLPAQATRQTQNQEADTKPAPQQPTKLSAMTPLTPVPATPAAQGPESQPVPVAAIKASTDKTASTPATSAKKPSSEKTPLKHKQENKIKPESNTKRTTATPAKPSPAQQSAHSSRLIQNTEARVETTIDTIVYQRWEQNQPGSTFPQAQAIECSTGKGEIVCWTNVIAAKHNSREYRYKIKMILDKFNTDKQFVMTYRNLILSSDGRPVGDETGGLGALPEKMKSGWAPLINRLPCQLASHDKIVCRPVGEKEFVLNGKVAQASFKN